jgi:glycerol-3-phosphate dehydrogenase
MVAVLARTAAAHGAALATNVRMDDLITSSGRVAGIRASDLLTGAALETSARHVALATGAWTGQGDGPEADLRVRPSKGVHIVVPRNRIAMDTGLLMRTEKSVLFVIPWGEHWLIGDTDTEWPFDPSLPVASRADIDYLLAKVNGMLREPLTAADIEGVFAGLRPLVAASAGADTTKLSREHSVRSPAPGLSVIAGGKYTTYRVMARDLIDVAVRDLGAGRGPAVQPSRTDEVPLAGADGYHDMWDSRGEIAESAGLPVVQVERLLGRYGSDLRDLLALVAGRPALKEPVPGADPYLGAEIVYACSHEGAVHLDDVLSRRTRIRIEVRDRGAAAAPHAAELMAAELSWDPARMAAEVSRYLDMIAADLAAESMPDDQSAFEAATDHIRGLGEGSPSPPITSIGAD